MRITCPHCGREDVEEAELSRFGVKLEGTDNGKGFPLYFMFQSNSPLCIDCANVASHFVRKGLRAFRESLASSKQLDLFPAEKLTSES